MSTTDETIAGARPFGAPVHRRLHGARGPFLVAAVALAAVMATQLFDYGSENLSIRLLNGEAPASWSHRVVTAILVAATISGLMGATRSQTRRGAWRVATSILCFLSIAEITSLHAHIDSMHGGKALYAPILLTLAVCVWRISKGSNQQAVLSVGLATLLVSYGTHVFGSHISSAIGWGVSGWGLQLRIGVKEGAELAGWLLIFAALSRLALSRPTP